MLVVDVKADMLRSQVPDAGSEVLASTGETCVLYCGHGSVNAGQGKAKMPRYRPMQLGNDGKLDGQEGRVHQMHVDWEMRLKVRPILMCWRVSLPVDTTAEAGPTPHQQHGGMHRPRGQDLV